MPSWLGGHVSEAHLHRNAGRDPFKNCQKFRSKTRWIGSPQPEKFRKNWSWTTFPGQTGRNFGWIDRPHYILGSQNVATGCINGIFFDENFCDSVRKKSNWLL